MGQIGVRSSRAGKKKKGYKDFKTDNTGKKVCGCIESQDEKESDKFNRS